MTLSWVGFGVANSCFSIIFIPSLSSKPVNSVSSHSCPSETFPHWSAAPVRWLFLEGRMFNWLLWLWLLFLRRRCWGGACSGDRLHTHTHTSQAALTRRLQECSTHLWASFYRQHKDQTCKRDTIKKNQHLGWSGLEKTLGTCVFLALIQQGSKKNKDFVPL